MDTDTCLGDEPSFTLIPVEVGKGIQDDQMVLSFFNISIFIKFKNLSSTVSIGQWLELWCKSRMVAEFGDALQCIALG